MSSHPHSCTYVRIGITITKIRLLSLLLPIDCYMDAGRSSSVHEGKYIYTCKLTALAACKPHNTAPLSSNITTPYPPRLARGASNSHS